MHVLDIEISIPTFKYIMHILRGNRMKRIFQHVYFKRKQNEKNFISIHTGVFIKKKHFSDFFKNKFVKQFPLHCSG